MMAYPAAAFVGVQEIHIPRPLLAPPGVRAQMTAGTAVWFTAAVVVTGLTVLVVGAAGVLALGVI